MPHQRTPTTRTLAHYPSASRPHTTYTVKIGQDNVIYCDCPAWRFQKLPTWRRDCKHTHQTRQHLIDRSLEHRHG